MDRTERVWSADRRTAAGVGSKPGVPRRRRRASVGCDSGVPGRKCSPGITAALALGLAGLIAAVAAGCGGGAQQISLTSKDNTTTIKAAKGDTIVLKLDENPSTGYHWVMQFSRGLRMTSNEYKQRSGTQNLVGAGGTHTWTIDVTASGKQTISGTYEPPGTQSVVPQRFSVTIDVG